MALNLTVHSILGHPPALKDGELVNFRIQGLAAVFQSNRLPQP